MNPQPDVSIVIPVYRSASILPTLAARLQEVLDLHLGAGRYETILVHDHGPDDSWKVITELARDRPWLRGIDLRRNSGQHNALMAGIGQARGRHIVTMDDDLQHNPEDIPRILQALESADLCYVQFESRQHATWKRLGSAFNDWVATRLLNKPRGLYLSPFRGFRAGVRDEAVRYRGPFVYLDGLLLQSTDNITTITARHHAREDGQSGYSLGKSIALWLQMATSFSIVPLRLVSMAGMAASLVAFAFAALILVRKLMMPEMAVGWASLIVAILFMGGLQLLALGAIGEYVGRVLLNVNQRPQYVIGDTVNLDRDGAER